MQYQNYVSYGVAVLSVATWLCCYYYVNPNIISAVTDALPKVDQVFALQAALLLAVVLLYVERVRAAAERDRAAAERDRAVAERDRAVALANGTYFASIDDVWTFTQCSFHGHFGELFVRVHHVQDVDGNQQIDGKGRYEKTVDEANIIFNNVITGRNENREQSTASNDVSFDSVRTADSSDPVDIFEIRDDSAQSAHLLPHSKSCASYWFPVVPWVLCTGTNKETLTWDFLQACIHGSKLRNPLAAMSTGSTSSSWRIAGTGIKHLRTNRIRLKGQKTYLDDYPCVIIVPIMSASEVRKWNGQAYDAIVLAGSFVSDKKRIRAEDVYVGIGASGKMLENYENCLATENQCQIACDLLTEMILCICNMLHLRTDLYQDLEKAGGGNFKDWDAAITKLGSKAHVPVLHKWHCSMNVRKISFSDCTKTRIRAPDPALLLAKATTVWLKRHDIDILPGCDDADSAISDETESSGYVVFIDTKPEPCIDQIDIHLDNINEVDEQLSDDDT
jgi:hypothetical protein